ncbi:MAG: metallophosphoesterase family protein [Pseudomonadota bacterium]
MAPQTDLSQAKAPPDTRIYAIGDIHGRIDLLSVLLRQVAEDAANAPEARRVIVYLGDYVDRGPDSAAVLDTLTSDLPDRFERVCLKGNHEALFLEFLDNADDGSLWLANGGDKTMESYGVTVVDDPLGMPMMHDALARAIPDAHLRFLRSLALSHREGDYFFAHAGVRPGTPLDSQREEDLIWIRDEFLRAPAPHECVVVHGHTPVREAEIHANRIAVDTGAVWSERLTALVLYGGERRFLHT